MCNEYQYMMDVVYSTEAPLALSWMKIEKLTLLNKRTSLPQGIPELGLDIVLGTHTVPHNAKDLNVLSNLTYMFRLQFLTWPTAHTTGTHNYNVCCWSTTQILYNSQYDHIRIAGQKKF